MPPALVMTGDKALDRKFRVLPAKLQKQIMRKPLREAAKAVAAKAIALAPRDTGDLAKAITVRVGIAKRGGKTGQPKGGIGFRVHVRVEKLTRKSETGFYPAHVELGSAHNAPQPYMRPALEGVGPAARAEALQKIKRGIEAAGRAGV